MKNIYDYILEIERYGQKEYDLDVSDNRRLLGYFYEGFYCQIEKRLGEVISFTHLKNADKKWNDLKTISNNKKR